MKKIQEVALLLLGILATFFSLFGANFSAATIPGWDSITISATLSVAAMVFVFSLFLGQLISGRFRRFQDDIVFSIANLSGLLLLLMALFGLLVNADSVGIQVFVVSAVLILGTLALHEESSHSLRNILRILIVVGASIFSVAYGAFEEIRVSSACDQCTSLLFSMFVPVALVTAITSVRVSVVWIALTMSLMFAHASALAGSRAATLAIAGSLVVANIGYFFLENRVKSGSLARLFGVNIFTGLGLLIGWARSPNLYKWSNPGDSSENPIRPAVEIPFSTIGDGGIEVPLGGTANGRLELWRRLLGLLDSPIDWIVGLGPGQASRISRVNQERWGFYHPHNEFIRLLVDSGIVGLLLVAIFLFSVWKRYYSTANYSRRLYFLLTLAWLAVSGMFDNPLVSPYLFVPFLLLMGIGSVDESDYKREVCPEQTPRQSLE